MNNLPHRYLVQAESKPDANVSITSEGLAPIVSAPPIEFGGPGDRWSPETLLVAAVADCFVLSFKAIARASKLPWNALGCEVEGVLERADGVLKFTEFVVRAVLEVPADTSEERASRILEKAESTCLVTNSLSSVRHLEARVEKRS